MLNQKEYEIALKKMYEDNKRNGIIYDNDTDSLLSDSFL